MASHSTRYWRTSFICAHKSPRKLRRKFLSGSAAGTLVMLKLVNSPQTASAIRITPDHACCLANVLHSQPPATVPPMMAINVPSSSTPLPQDNFLSGSSSGSKPYLEGPKNEL